MSNTFAELTYHDYVVRYNEKGCLDDKWMLTGIGERQIKRNDASKLIGKAKQEADDSRVSELSKDVQNLVLQKLW